MAKSFGPIDHPESLGEEIQRLRRAAGVSLDDIVAETKVSRRIFEALEAGRYQHLPEKVFCRNFLRQYAVIVGCEHGSLIEAFDSAWERFQEMSGSFATLKVEELPKTNTRWSVWLPFLLAAVVLGTLLVFAIRSSEGPDQLPPDPRRSNAEQPTPLRVMATPTPGFVSEAVPDHGESPDENADVVVLLKVAPSKECWVHYRDRNGHVGEVLLGGGETTTLELPGPVLLTIGNADAASIEVGGLEFTDLGKPGEVVRFLLDEGGLTPFSGETHDG